MVSFRLSPVVGAPSSFATFASLPEVIFSVADSFFHLYSVTLDELSPKRLAILLTGVLFTENHNLLSIVASFLARVKSNDDTTCLLAASSFVLFTATAYRIDAPSLLAILLNTFLSVVFNLQEISHNPV